MKTVLVTGGAGFLGSLLLQRLLALDYSCVSIDLIKHPLRHENLRSVRGDIRDMEALEKLCQGRDISAIFHCAAVLAHAVRDKSFLWTSNVDGTGNVVRLALRHNIGTIVFISSNCLWGRGFGRPVREDDEPAPVEIYGQSKLVGEQILLREAGECKVIVLRSPTIIDAGRLGLLAIFFEFIREGRIVWLVGSGNNRYQFVCAQDVVDACLKALAYPRSGIFHVGSDNVRSLREVYQAVVEQAGTGSRLVAVPRVMILPMMRAASALRLSPLGPYHYKMIAENFVFDTAKIKSEFGWCPTLTNEQMLCNAYKYYRDNWSSLSARSGASPHRSIAPMGMIKLLKWLS